MNGSKNSRGQEIKRSLNSCNAIVTNVQGGSTRESFVRFVLRYVFLLILRALDMIEGERVKRKVRALKIEKKIRRLKLSVEEKKTFVSIKKLSVI